MIASSIISNIILMVYI